MAIITRPLIGNRHALGHAEIDADHFAIANWWMRATQCAPIALPFHIAGLRKSMRDHFGRESALVEASGVSFCACHRNEHNVLLELCDDAYALTARNLRSARALLRNKLPRLMRDHINTMDQIAVLMMRDAAEKRAAIAPHR
ncbi:MAG: hypothetical protein AB7K35_11800 [Pseudorhodoplanes sp.]